ncbi:MAG: sensor histidine kinase [Alkalispirochaeta sp.]
MVGGTELFVSLLNNLAIFIALVAVYRYLLVRTGRPTTVPAQLLHGIVFGLFAMGGMLARIPVYEGVIVDQRNAVVALSGVFGGPVAAVVTAAFAASFRAILGGGGVLAGVIGLSLAAASGVLLHHIRNSFTTARSAALSAIGATIIILPGFLFVGDIEAGWELTKAMAIPYGGAIFLGIFFVGLLLEHQVGRHQVEASLRESEEKYRVLFESFPLGIAITDEHGHVIETNTSDQRFDGSTSIAVRSGLPEVQSLKIVDQTGNLIAPENMPGSRAIREGRRIADEELGVVGESGIVTWLSATAAPMKLEGYGAAVVYKDVTARRRAEQTARQALEEKSVLLQELFHRTRNMMQLIVALLNWQAQHVEAEETRTVLREAQNRIRTMALVHQKLYESENLSYINLGTYIRDVVRLLQESHNVDPGRIEVRFDLSEDVFVLVDTAIPFGLVFEEVVTNAFRHAFTGGQEGAVILHLHREAQGEMVLNITDNGIGLSQGFDPRTDGHLGLQMVFALSEQQLGGHADMTSVDGVSFSLRFTDNLYAPRV